MEEGVRGGEGRNNRFDIFSVRMNECGRKGMERELGSEGS